MKYSVTVEIDLPITVVIDLFDSAENMYKWQPTLISHKHLSGEPGQKGAKMQLVYKMGTKNIEMLETITRRELPDLFAGTYEAKGVWNEVVNHFTSVNDERTVWRMDTEFKCSGVMGIMCFLMPFMFKKETRDSMNRFKTFAESESS